MGSSKWGCLSAVVIGGVGLVLFALGFDSHTTEAMPFGAVLTTVGLFIGVPSLQALRGALGPGVRPVRLLLYVAMVALSVGLVLVGLGAQPHTTEVMPFGLAALALGFVLAIVALSTRQTEEVVTVGGDPALGPVEAEPPTSVKCGNCGSPAPLRLSDPTHATCAHCGTRFALPATLAAVLEAADLAVRARGEAERRISATLKALPEKHVAWHARLRRSSGGLAALAVLTVFVGISRRNEDTWWTSYVFFGVASGAIALGLGGSLSRLIPRVARSIVGHWAALQIPGVEGLSCRVCGAKLPGVAAPVLKCEYCSAESLAGPAVQALVAKQAGHAVRSVLFVTQRDAKADELAAFSLVAFPLVTLVGWFAVGAYAGLGGREFGELHVGAADIEFAVVRVKGKGVCAAARIPRGDQLELRFSGEVWKRLQPSELAQFAVEPNVGARWFVGQHVNGLGKLEAVYSLLESPNRVEGSMGTLSLYFPYDGLGGELICLDEVEATGLALELE